MSEETTFQQLKSGLSKDTRVSLSLAGGVIMSVLAGGMWINGIDRDRGQELRELDNRLTRVESQTETMAGSLKRIEQTLDDIRFYLLKQPQDQ